MRNAPKILLLGISLACAPTFAQNSDHGGVGSRNVNQQRTRDIKVVKGPVVEWVGDTTAVIAWSTDAPSKAALHYGNSPGSLSQRHEVPSIGRTHRVKLSSLKPATKYYYRLDDTRSRGAGVTTESQLFEFETVAKGHKGKRYKAAKATK